MKSGFIALFEYNRLYKAESDWNMFDLFYIKGINSYFLPSTQLEEKNNEGNKDGHFGCKERVHPTPSKL